MQPSAPLAGDSGSAVASTIPVSGELLPPVGVPASPETTLLVCDARPVVRAGLRAILTGSSVVGECGLEDAVDRIQLLRPSVLIAGLRDDDPETFRVVASAKALHPALRVLVVADGATVIDLREAVIAGVDSFLLTSAPAEELRDAVVRTARAERVISPSIAMQLAGSWRSEPRESGASALTPRELEVLQLLAEGLTNQQVGTRLGLSARTVKTHVQNLLVKLDVPDRTGAVARAFRLGLIR
ncbi:response regulator transcription factor [Egicoccus halophilus]|uniref:DNA-binding response regulator n=1 Tax=Egicoccus halophilus TaxID=1670830 RepID=A0A8J3EZ21_9ACTN|nr:response regulator transcription factor [Egicoccus halophilus]GGI09015.1 DNA-binding response regulator [Egicoccus halophilus]